MPTLPDDQVRSPDRRRSAATRGSKPKPQRDGLHSHDPRWRLVQRISESRSLGRSERLAEFLRYIADRSIRGDDSQITEQQIGVHVFGRAYGYDSNNDNIVRNYARTLRKRLDEYFRSEGLEEPLTITIPLGGYVPTFVPRDSEAPAESGVLIHTSVPAVQEVEAAKVASPASFGLSPAEAVPSDMPMQAEDTRRFRWNVTATVLALFCAVLLGFVAGRTRGRSFNVDAAPARSRNALWEQMFAHNRDTFVVPSDGGLVMLQNFSREQVNLPDYVSGTYRTAAVIDNSMQGLLKHSDTEDMRLLAHKTELMAARRYTSMVDLDTVLQIARLPEVVPDHLLVRFARDLRIDDLRNGNAVLIGSNDANPWVALFESQLNFQFSHGAEFGGSGSIVNTHPLPHEQPRYSSITGDTANNTYGVIAYVPNLSGNGHILLVEGVNTAGTQAAGNLLMNDDKMHGLIERALDRNGKLQSFEILLKTNSIASNAAGVDVLSERVHPTAAP